MTVSDVIQPTLPNGEKADPKTIAAKVTGMFMEMMIKTMEDNIEAESGGEDGLFGNSSSSEIYRGMVREQLAASVSAQLKSPFERQLEQGIHNQMPQPASPALLPSLPGQPAEPISEYRDGALPVKGVVSSPVGWRRDPIAGDMRFHKGTDIAAPYGSDVRSMAEGIVVESGPKGGYGNAVVVQLADGRKMLYGHNSVNLVHTGDHVQEGEIIAQVGATGRATGPHVHFEIIEPETKISLKSGNGSSDNTSGKDFHQPTKDGPGAPL